ncbi:MAG: hypothetical protein AMJ79_10570 [Phycisphaerae bacterium SM23_30]|nr:MAG: hypothetical protein AMJ79_10570 [Phycisphaerae bacterium SM23_30]
MARRASSNTEIADRSDRLTPETLVQGHAAAVLALCLAHTPGVHDAEDMMQDVFLKAFTKINTLRDPAKARPWLLQIARRTCTDLHRRRRPSQPLNPDHVPARPESDLKSLERLHAALARLPEDYRETISLYYLDGRRCAAVAQSLNISAPAVRQRLVRARLMLHDLLVEDKS